MKGTQNCRRKLSRSVREFEIPDQARGFPDSAALGFLMAQQRALILKIGDLIGCKLSFHVTF